MRQIIRRTVAAEVSLVAGLPPRLRSTVRARIAARARTGATSPIGPGAARPALVAAAVSDLAHVRARVQALSPQATLDRGYAVVTRSNDGAVVRGPAEATGQLRIRVAHGEFAATADSIDPIPSQS